MTNIAGITRDPDQSLTCPKCAAAMEKVTFAGETVDRCVNCKGLWFDAREHVRLKGVKGSEAIDTGPAAATPTPAGTLTCPVCKGRLIAMTDPKQPHLKFEACTVCYGVFFDAGEFRDFKEVTLAETIRGLFNRG